jgi:hypothetical protein
MDGKRKPSEVAEIFAMTASGRIQRACIARRVSDKTALPPVRAADHRSGRPGGALCGPVRGRTAKAAA